MKTPTHLKHKPIIAVDNYDNASDAKALSIGEAQWENNATDISAKIFRHNDDSDDGAHKAKYCHLVEL